MRMMRALVLGAAALMVGASATAGSDSAAAEVSAGADLRPAPAPWAGGVETALLGVPAPLDGAGLATRAGSSPTPTPTPTPMTPTPTSGSALPATPVGDQVGWLITASRRLPLSAAEVQAHVDQTLIAAAGGVDALNAALTAVAGANGLTLVSVPSAAPTTLTAIVDGAQRWQLSAAVDADGLLASLTLLPYRPSPSSWAELDRRLRAVAPAVSFQASRLTADGRCLPVHGVAADTPRPIGSAFKLYVLAALADAVATGHAAWDEPLAIRDDWKSLPSGVLQNAPAGTTLTLEQYAQYMISISDNTAADHLIHRLGRERVERQLVRSGMRRPALDVPFLTTREFFQFKAAPDHPGPLQTYLRLPVTQRLRYLTDMIDPRPLTGLAGWEQPRAIDTLEWFASPADICRVYANLARAAGTSAGAPVAGILSLNDGGLGLDRARWPAVWFKGGSEPGVLTLTYLARTAGGARYVVSVDVGDPVRALDEASVVPELLALARGGFQLAAR